MTSKEMQEQMVSNLKRWQKIENASVVSTGKVMEKTDHPLLRMVMEIIQRDSQTHYHLQQMIIDSMEVKPFSLTPEDISAVWDLIENHIEIEKSTIEMANEILGNMKAKYLTPQIYLLRYLLKDEEKHNAMLEALEQVKKDIYPYA
ncbi:MAG: hypothetical protein P9L92_06495 [Candidatus Electryonea clarkiae]|nr:hypothetical protein [Candidatus Electryonea clarkiae]MDP8287485.1 hypothetical protein [Candidatus Electryonea clarkiae]